MIKDSFRLDYLSDGDIDHDLYHLFARARYLTFRAREKELQRYNLSPVQAQLLFVIHVLDHPPTPAEISRFLFRRPNTISTLVRRMEKKGLLKACSDPERKHQVRISLTPKGREAYAQTTKRGPIHRVMGSLTEEERKQFRKFLEKISEAAQQEAGDIQPCRQLDATSFTIKPIDSCQYMESVRKLVLPRLS